MPFFPSADAAVLTSKRPLPSTRPQAPGPIFDPDGLDKPIDTWNRDTHESNFPPNAEYATVSIPEPPACGSDRYLRATLAKNERLRLSMLWYYTRDILNEVEFLSGLQEKVHLAKESADWEFAIIGFLDVNYYTRLAAVGVPLGILPRGETICAHTINQPPGDVFLMPNMLEDWRFKDSPYVESGKLHAYAGAPLRLQSESGETVGLGSLCVASGTSQAPLTKPQQRAIAYLADWVVSDLVQCARVRRQRERRVMSERIAAAQAEMDLVLGEEPVLDILRATYPEAAISLRSAKAAHIEVEGRDPLAIAELDNDGVWEDTDYIDDFITRSNCFDMPTDRVVRILNANIESPSGSNVLIVASKDFRLIFDDIDLWFVQTCAGIISQAWHKRLLKEAIKAKDEFLRGFSHQLRTPIHGILGCVELLAEELLAKNTLAEAASTSASAAGSDTPYLYLDTIKTSGRDLISIVNSMITLNRWAEIATAERTSATHSLQQLEADLAEETNKIFSGDSRYQPSVFFSCTSPPGCDSFQTNHDMLRDSLLPLIVNAIQNTPEGIVSVKISLYPDVRELVVDVEDMGHGIEEADRQRIFEPYEKIGEHSTGAGLGLTIAAKFAALLHGSVALVRSDVGKGSHFRATFRELDCIPSECPAQPLASRFEHLPSRYHHLPLASSEDAPAHCQSLATLLTQHGFSPSPTLDDSFALVEHVSCTEKRRKYLLEIPPRRLAVCLSPASGEKSPKGETPKNLVYIDWPYSTASITTVLAEADKLQKELSSSLHTEHPTELPISPPLTPPNDNAGVRSVDVVVDSLAKTDLSKSQPEQLPEPVLVPPTAEITPAPSPTPQPIPIITGMPSTQLHLTTSHPTALLVDDNAINLRFMQMYCEKRKLPYLSAADGQQAVDIFLQHQQRAAAGEGAAIQLVLMDLQMPVCDGLEATRQIRSLESKHGWNQSTLFVVTGQDTLSDRDASKTAGADDYLVKPVSLKLLDSHIRQGFPDFTGK
ncbi:histidine kinase HHK3 [Plectosphaerella plurivora]|uniref:histidine kinase n=1 Tax=Plectosphaerella plurivora TaxID=936078 RepID=A0A9P8V979_9PEZI|nr:histidine kinase HHK3 [Plectosphaerella plurivora]